MQLNFLKKYCLSVFVVHASATPERPERPARAPVVGQLQRNFILSAAFSMNIKRVKHV